MGPVVVGVDGSESAAEALCFAAGEVDEADGAELLVVGSRGLAGLREALLGSVSHFCCQHAPCPVVVVRHAEAASPTSRSAPTTSPDSCSTPTGAPSSSPSCSTSSTASRVSRPAMVRDLQGYGDRNGRQQEGGNHAT